MTISASEAATVLFSRKPDAANKAAYSSTAFPAAGHGQHHDIERFAIRGSIAFTDDGFHYQQRASAGTAALVLPRIGIEVSSSQS